MSSTVLKWVFSPGYGPLRSDRVVGNLFVTGGTWGGRSPPCDQCGQREGASVFSLHESEDAELDGAANEHGAFFVPVTGAQTADVDGEVAALARSILQESYAPLCCAAALRTLVSSMFLILRMRWLVLATPARSPSLSMRMGSSSALSGACCSCAF